MKDGWKGTSDENVHWRVAPIFSNDFYQYLCGIKFSIVLKT